MPVQEHEQTGRTPPDLPVWDPCIGPPKHSTHWVLFLFFLNLRQHYHTLPYWLVPNIPSEYFLMSDPCPHLFSKSSSIASRILCMWNSCPFGRTCAPIASLPTLVNAQKVRNPIPFGGCLRAGLLRGKWDRWAGWPTVLYVFCGAGTRHDRMLVVGEWCLFTVFDSWGRGKVHKCVATFWVVGRTPVVVHRAMARGHEMHVIVMLTHNRWFWV